MNDIFFAAFHDELEKLSAYGIVSPPKTPTPRMPGVLKKRPARIKYRPPASGMETATKVPGVSGPDYLP